IPLRYLSWSSRSPYLEQSAGPLNSMENSAASLVSSTCADTMSSRLPKRPLNAMRKALTSVNSVTAPCTPTAMDASWAKMGVAQMSNCKRNWLHLTMVFPSYRKGRRSFSVFLSEGDTGDDITGDEGDRGLPEGKGGECDCPLGKLQEEQVHEWPRSGDDGGGTGKSLVGV
ncbi:hypothetical protein POSPLADRAFT_1149040, partial [Postia placenta MAD-698-R-SB12]